MKKCQYCAEEIQDEAIKCKHCHEMFRTAATQPLVLNINRSESKQITKEEINENKDNRNTVLKIVILCTVFPIVMIIFSAAFDTSIAGMLVLLPIEGVVVWLAWTFLRKVLRISSIWALTLLSTGLGLAVSWYAAFRMTSSALLREVWLNSEKTLGHTLTESESSDLYSRTLRSEEFWRIVHQKDSIPAIGVFLLILVAIVMMTPKTERMRSLGNLGVEAPPPLLNSTKSSPFLGIGMIASATGLAILFTDDPSFGYKIGSSLGQILGSAILALPIFLIWRYATKTGRTVILSRSFNIFATILVVTWLLLFVIAKNFLPSFANGYNAARTSTT